MSLVPARVAFAEVPASSWDDGCFDRGQTVPLWKVAIYADLPLIHRVRVCDHDDQEHEVLLGVIEAQRLFDLLTGTGPLSRRDVTDAMRLRLAPASIRAALRAYRSKRTPPHVWEAAREVLVDAGLVLT